MLYPLLKDKIAILLMDFVTFTTEKNMKKKKKTEQMAIVFWTGFKAVVDESQVLQSLLTFPDKQRCNLDMKVLRLTLAMSPSGFSSLFRVSAWISFLLHFFLICCIFFSFFHLLYKGRGVFLVIRPRVFTQFRNSTPVLFHFSVKTLQ